MSIYKREVKLSIDSTPELVPSFINKC